MADSRGNNKQDVLQVIFATIDEINETLPQDRKLAKTLETRLFGRHGLESLEFVNFIVLLEQRIGEDWDRAVALADERAVSREVSPFSTVDRLADYVIGLLKDSAND